ncbi:MAG: hypothetical protein HZA78_09220 [Candidatus Schekmanbacteria bacterium]|nr:hypothetical protein [Candidatus Schekmanbacteria bacterium]
MSSTLNFGDTAKALAKNPLGIIALFIVLIYGFASLVVGASSNLQSVERIPLIWFLVIFPFVVLGVFAWLVSNHHKNLYAPSDFKDERHFVGMLNPNLEKLKFVSSDKSKNENESGGKGIPNNLAVVRKDIYAHNRGYFIGHVLEPSKKEGQEYDIFIYLIRHISNNHEDNCEDNYEDVSKAEFFFGHYWGNKLFEGTKVGNLIGVKTSAYGPFLALCKITFKDGSNVLLNKYIDFEMGVVFKKCSDWIAKLPLRDC